MHTLTLQVSLCPHDNRGASVAFLSAFNCVVTISVNPQGYFFNVEKTSSEKLEKRIYKNDGT